MGTRDSYLDGYGILNISLASDSWTAITFPVQGVKYFEIQEQTGTAAFDYRKSATETSERRVNPGYIHVCHADLRESASGGQLRRVGSTTLAIQIYYEY